MTKREAYKLGQRLGAQAAEYCEVGDSDREQADCECRGAVGGKLNASGDAPETCAECIASAAFESEQGARDYSPWEVYASAINGARDPEGQWEAYDAGVAAGVKAGVKARLAGRQS